MDSAERDALAKRVFDNAAFGGQPVKLVNWCDAAAVIETLESLGFEISRTSGPTQEEKAFAYCENCGRALTEDEASKDPVSEGYFCEDRERCHG